MGERFPVAVSVRAVPIVLIAAASLLWPAVWNGYPIVFADTGTYLSQAIHHYLGWDRPVFYSLMMLPLHLTVSTWPVIIVQAVLASVVLRMAVRKLAPEWSDWWLVALAGFLAAMTWFPWIVSELMPDLFTPLLVLLLSLLVFVPDRLSPREVIAVVLAATFMIATQQSSLALAPALIALLWPLAWWLRRENVAAVHRPPLVMARADSKSTSCRADGSKVMDGAPAPTMTREGQWASSDGRAGPEHVWAHTPIFSLGLTILPVVLAIFAMATVNLIGHGRLSVSPFGNVFLLARLIHDGPALAVLKRDCPQAGWRLCPYLDRIPPTSDEFLWEPDSPVILAGGHKAVSVDADAIIAAAIRSYPIEVLQAAAANTLHQMRRFASGDGLEPWPVQVTPWIKQDFPAREFAAYRAARQQSGVLTVPALLATVHQIVAIIGAVLCLLLLPRALRRRHPATGFLAAALLAMPLSAAITGAMSMPHDRYQSRIMWLPSCVALIGLAALHGHRPGNTES